MKNIHSYHTPSREPRASVRKRKKSELQTSPNPESESEPEYSKIP